ncbi:hypothetical protein EJ076_33445 [Mesorhizobium sp. M7D.F.Ca.US.005.01.1.1]|uniref:hypothetical protein n=1 Tax=Mesorhizobium sp. M7D.F.Ca.US.005.01.1.1 TaxID=2493678 RepID=UPI000F75ADD8|nr:hypothetical protein [Mesorhizobium sp. M7D.F.Ca.US.005.01.1.1]AZO45639.1 hypothetical protein EJ076_33445 [Mesorhizobium sp. M7D.F.Ca.US.005.01.1.1]
MWWTGTLAVGRRLIRHRASASNSPFSRLGLDRNGGTHDAHNQTNRQLNMLVEQYVEVRLKSSAHESVIVCAGIGAAESAHISSTLIDPIALAFVIATEHAPWDQ